MRVNPAPYYINISELRKSPSKVIHDAKGHMVAVFNHGEIISYLVSPTVIEELFEMKADLDTIKEVDKMDLSQAIDVDIDDL